MRYGYQGSEPLIERRGHAARIINTTEVRLTDHKFVGSWRNGRYKRTPSDTLKALPPTDQKALLAGARTKRERKALAALM
jgi:hypothetical protein